MAYAYDREARRYRDTDTGRFVSQRTIDRTRDALIDRSRDRIGALTDRLHAGEVTLSDWRTAMRAEIKQIEVQQYLLGRGGRNVMTPRDWGRIGAEVRRQYRYLDRLVAEYQRGEISDAAFRSRARMYTSGSNAAFSRAQGEAWAIALPAHPGDGSTRCLGYCKCSWSITQTATEIHATWRLGGSRETCPDCVQRSHDWAPLRFDHVVGTLLTA
jgi:hypothetical protein